MIVKNDTHTWDVEITSWTRPSAARTWGAVENCYPAEVGDLEYEVLGCIEYDENGFGKEVPAHDSDELRELVWAKLEGME